MRFRPDCRRKQKHFSPRAGQGTGRFQETIGPSRYRIRVTATVSLRIRPPRHFILYYSYSAHNFDILIGT